MRRLTRITFYAEIFIGGDALVAKQLCREYCRDHGLCVTVEPCSFVYTGGAEEGVKIGLTNYPRFPTTRSKLMKVARELGALLQHGLCQTSHMIRGDKLTEWYSSRPEQ